MESNEYEVKWHIENKVAIFNQYQEATIQNTQNMINAANQLINSSPQDKVPIIINVSGMTGSRANIKDISREFRERRSEKWGFTIVIGANRAVKFLARIFFELAKIEIRFASDLDEAMQILYRIYPNLLDSSGQ